MKLLSTLLPIALSLSATTVMATESVKNVRGSSLDDTATTNQGEKDRKLPEGPNSNACDGICNAKEAAGCDGCAGPVPQSKGCDRLCDAVEFFGCGCGAPQCLNQNEGCTSFAEPDACCSGLYCNKGVCDPCVAGGLDCNGAYPGECCGGKFLCDGNVLYDVLPNTIC